MQVRLRLLWALNSQEFGTKTSRIEPCTRADLKKIVVIVEQEPLCRLLGSATIRKPILHGSDDHRSPQPPFSDEIIRPQIAILLCSHHVADPDASIRHPSFVEVGCTSRLAREAETWYHEQFACAQEPIR